MRLSCMGRNSGLGLLFRYAISGVGPGGGPFTPLVGGGGPDGVGAGDGPL